MTGPVEPPSTSACDTFCRGCRPWSSCADTTVFVADGDSPDPLRAPPASPFAIIRPHDSEPMPLVAGTRLGSYEIVSLLGAGCGADVRSECVFRYAICRISVVVSEGGAGRTRTGGGITSRFTESLPRVAVERLLGFSWRGTRSQRALPPTVGDLGSLEAADHAEQCRLTRAAPDGRNHEELSPRPLVSANVDMAVTCQVSKTFPSSPS